MNPRNNGNFWFNPNDFAQAPFGVYGNVGRDAFHGPGIFNTDLVLSKLIRFTEQRYIEMRLEGYNVFNHTQFALPGTNIEAASTFGRITTATAGRTVQLGLKFYF